MCNETLEDWTLIQDQMSSPTKQKSSLSGKEQCITDFSVHENVAGTQ